jgi:branched-chain amino acid transport system permease protein
MKPPASMPSDRRYRLPAGLLLLTVLMPLLARGSYAYLLPLAQLCALYVIIVTGLTLLMGFTGQISLGHAGFYGFGAYVGAVLTAAYQAPLWIAIPLALLAGGCLALITGFMVLRLKGHHLALATLCLGVIIVEFISKARITGGAAGLYDLPEITLFGLLKKNPIGKVYFLWTMAWLVLLWAVQLTASPVGRALRAIHSDQDAAAAMGIPVFRIKLKVFVMSGVMASLAGVLYAFVYTPSYLGPEEFGLMLSVMLVTMVVIGGMGSIWGGLAGAVVMTGMHEVVTLAGEKLGFTDVSRFEQLIYGLLLVLMLVFCPKGLVPALQGWWRRKRVARGA